MNNIIEIDNVIKSYEQFTLGPINLNIPGGVIVGLIGENGAGKTTLIKSILNITNINQGNIKIFNKDSRKEEKIIKEDIGVVLDGSFFPELLTPNDIGNIMKSLYKNWDDKLFKSYLEKFSLDNKQSIKKMSKGMRKKLEIITSLSHQPKLLILDEPTSGLDPIVRSEILDIFLDFIKDEEHTILLSTHITSDLEHVADYIVFIDEGKIILNETRDDIIDKYGILKCSVDEFDKIDKCDIIRYRKNKYNVEILVSDKHKVTKKYPNMVVDKITLDGLMVLIIRGDAKC